MKTRFFPTAVLASLLAAFLFVLPVHAKQGAPEGKVAALAYAYFQDLPSDNNVITPDATLAMLDAGEDVFILDIRRPADYAKGHLKGAANLSFFDMSIAENLDKLPNDKPILVYCYTGQTASQVTVILNVAGKTAKNIQSGFNNGIAKVQGHETRLEQTERPLPAKTYPVDADVAKAVTAYFADKMAMDDTPFLNANLAVKTVKGIVDEQNDDFLIVSVRKADDYAKAHVPTARNIPFGQGMEKGLVTLPKDKKIIVYCYTGQTSSQVTTVLRLMGYDAYSMSGGMTAWTDASYDTEPKK